MRGWRMNVLCEEKTNWEGGGGGVEANKRIEERINLCCDMQVTNIYIYNIFVYIYRVFFYLIAFFVNNTYCIYN